MRRELPRSVGLKAGKQRQADAAELSRDVLLRHRRPRARHQPILDVGPVSLGLPHVLGKRRLELWIARHLARSFDLLQCL
jgi:hypothetical protein